MAWNRGKLAFIGALVAASGVISIPAASAEGERRGNWDLYVDANGCAYEWQDQAWCGPALVVHANMYLSEDDRYSSKMKLFGANGDVSLQYGADARFNPGRGSSAIDPNYWGPAFEKRTPSGGLAPGRYGLTLSVSVSGRWSCSIYSRDVCNFLEPNEEIYAWVFDWTGTTMQVPAVRFVREVETVVTGRTSSQPVVFISAAVLPRVEGIPVTIQRQKSNGKWETIATKRSKVLGLVMYTDKKAPKEKKLRYRLFVPGAPPDFALTMTARTK